MAALNGTTATASDAAAVAADDAMDADIYSASADADDVAPTDIAAAAHIFY